MVEVFYDRRGKEKYADDVIPFEQKGYFAILVKDCLLYTSDAADEL